MKASEKTRTSLLHIPSFILILFLLSVGLFLSGMNEAYAQSSKHLLDGTRFTGGMGEAGSDEVKWEEAITFKDGKMFSSACAPSGFENGEYVTRKEGDVIKFTAKCHSETEGDLDWTGTVINGVLEASYVWRKGNERWNYWIRCTKDKK